jgi:hypothetical protein
MMALNTPEPTFHWMRIPESGSTIINAASTAVVVVEMTAAKVKCGLKVIWTINWSILSLHASTSVDHFVGQHYLWIQPLNVKEELSELVKARSLEGTHLTADAIATTSLQEIVAKYPGVILSGITAIHALKQLVYRTRLQEFHDWEGAIKMAPLVHPLRSNDSADERLFLQFVVDVNIEENLEKIIGWGHPDLIYELKCGGPLNLFVDCTFKIAPRGFYQCMIIMAYLPASQLYVPVFWILLQSKKENVYYHALQHAICASEWKMEAKTITCDFEKGLMNECGNQFVKLL